MLLDAAGGFPGSYLITIAITFAYIQIIYSILVKHKHLSFSRCLSMSRAGMAGYSAACIHRHSLVGSPGYLRVQTEVGRRVLEVALRQGLVAVGRSGSCHDKERIITTRSNHAHSLFSSAVGSHFV